MNIFVIPSWYPSEDEPHTGIFFKEQTEALAHILPDSNFAISTWGSHERDLLLDAKNHIYNLPKIFKFPSKNSLVRSLKPNLTEYYTPALTWTRKIFSGNIKNIVSVNERHLLSFQEKVGKLNIIHAHSAYPAGWVAMCLAQKYQIPYIITEHMGPFPFKSFLLKSGALSKYLIRPFKSSHTNVAVSPQQKLILESWSIPHVIYVPNLINETFFSPGPPDVNKQGVFTFFALARLEEGKGISFLLKALKELHENHIACHLRIGGDGSQYEDLRLLSKELGIAEKVTWLGTINREETLKEYRNCDAFVLPSLSENLPLVLLEAIACGKPVISTRCGGPESIINKTNGILVEPQNARQLSNAMHHIYSNWDNYDKDTIRKDAVMRYSREVVCKQIMNVYKAAIHDLR